MWLIGGVVLAGAETLTGEFFLLMLAGGAFTTAGISALTDWPVWADAIVFALVSVLLVLGVRPALLRRFGAPPPIATGVDALPGRSAVVTEAVDEHTGRIRLDGDEWTARALPGQRFAAGDAVTIVEINGATAVVAGPPGPPVLP